MPINSVLRRLWLVCCLCVVCVQAQAQAWQSGDIIAIVYDGNYLTATSETAVGKTTTPTDAALWVVTVETTWWGTTNYYLKNVHYSTIKSPTNYYLRNFELTTNNTAWQWDNSNNAFKSGNNKYLVYNGNNFVVDKLKNNKPPSTPTYTETVEYSAGFKDNITGIGWGWASETRELVVTVTERRFYKPESNDYKEKEIEISSTELSSDNINNITTDWQTNDLQPQSVSVSGTSIVITTEHEPMVEKTAAEFSTADTRSDALIAGCVLKNGKTVTVTPLPMTQPVGRCEWVDVSSLAMTPDNYTFENRDMTHDFKMIQHSERGRRWFLSDHPAEPIDTAVVNKDEALVLTPAGVGLQPKVAAENWTVTLVDDSIMRVAVDGIAATAVNPAATLAYTHVEGSSYTTYTADLVQIVYPGEYKFYHQKGAAGTNYDARYMQGVHTVNYTIYLKQGEKYTFVPPEGAFRGYWRWYDYDTDLAITNDFQFKVNNTRAATPHGHFGTQTPLGSCGANLTMPDKNVHRIACDVSSYIDYSFGDKNKEITEPTLSYRVIYELRPASEMADNWSAYTGNTYLENYKLTAGTCAPIYLGAQYEFQNGGVHNNYYVKTNQGNVQPVNQYRWRANGTSITLPIVGGKYAKVQGNSPGTITYTLQCRYNNNGEYSGWVNVAKFEVEYKACDEVGPVQESAGGIVSNTELDSKYLLLAKLDFDYDKPGTTAYRAYNKPLAWDEATYGFCYVDPAKPQQYRMVSAAFPYYGEYMFINTTRGSQGAGWLEATDNRSGAENGYMLYCDGTTMAGQVVSLDLKAELCAGSRMFCSAWINSANTESGGASPVFQFQLVGIDAEGNEHEQTTFSTGEISPNQGWQQVFFSIESDGDYEKYRLRISNHCGASSGNDFLIDDIRVYQSTQVLSSMQASTTCQGNGAANIITPITRIDFQSMGVENINLGGAKCYYQWYNETTGKVITDIKYDNPNVANTCGYLMLPTGDTDIEANYSDRIYNTIHEFMQAAMADPSKRVGYIKEESEGVEHYVLYVAQDLQCGADTTVTFRAAFREQDLAYALCAMSSSFTVVPRVQLTLDNEPLTEESKMICANTSYRLSLRVYDSHDRVSTCLADWLKGSPVDSTDASNIAVYGYTFIEMLEALAELRQPLEIDGVPNPNLAVTSIDGIDRNYISDESYNVLSTLVSRDLLTLAAEYVDLVIVQTATDLDLNRIVIPINGTCADGYEVCNDMMSASFTLCNSGDYNLTLGRHGEKNQVQNQIRGVRVAKDFSAFYLPIDTSYYVQIDTVLLVSSDDPDFVSEDVTRVVLQPDKKDFIVWTAGASELVLTPNTTVSNFALKQGYSYTFGIRLTNISKQDSISVGTGRKCPVGTTYFTVKVVPDFVVWRPNGSSTSWNNDDNWAMADEYGNVLGGGFVPMDHTNIIIPDLGENGAYPVLNTSTVVPDHQAAPIEPAAQQYISYDFDYAVNRCHNIHFQPNAQLGNQHMLSYNKAWVEMLLPTWRWHLYAFPVHGTVSGDMYVPLDNYADAVPFSSGGDCDNRTVYYFAQSLFNRSVSNMYESGQQVDITSVTWSAPANAMNVSYPVGTGAALWVYNSSNFDDQNIVVRLPKDATRYNYYYNTGQVSGSYEDVARPTNHGRLGFEPTFGADTAMTITLTNNTDGKLFMLGNPAMSTLDLQQFFAENDDVFTGTFYRIPDTEGSDMMDMEACTKYTVDVYNGYLLPFRSILAETINKTTSIEAKFTPSMFKVNRDFVYGSVLPPVTPTPMPIRRTHAKRTAEQSQIAMLQIDALCNEYYSTLLLGETAEASDDVVPGEDAELITFADKYMETASAHTAIYTKADDKPLSVNVMDKVKSVPLTYHCVDGAPVKTFTLWFDGVSSFAHGLQLYDDYEKLTIPLCDGMMLELEGVPSDYPRYYIQRLNYSPDDDDDNTPTDLSTGDAAVTIAAYAQPNGTTHVAASTMLDAVRAYSTTGQLILELQNIAHTTTQFVLPQGAYLLHISTTAGDAVVRKIVVR
ncbi:MAG: hypothetical protein PUE55_00440 [Bacteroidales bacterium]|nr:hypothetical protein [Bacteroidales bacterium]